jgi:hypothetical protein
MGEQQKSSKGAPPPRKRRGRTENRRRERFIRKAAKKIAKLVEAGKDATVIREEMARSQAAQSAKIKGLVKK